ncbi:Uncharacterised protein [Acinetobacter baumannii]|nr:Uncharacterised protein [Acinetobacter baumannii]
MDRPATEVADQQGVVVHPDDARRAQAAGAGQAAVAQQHLERRFPGPQPHQAAIPGFAQVDRSVRRHREIVAHPVAGQGQISAHGTGREIQGEHPMRPAPASG